METTCQGLSIAITRIPVHERSLKKKSRKFPQGLQFAKSLLPEQARNPIAVTRVPECSMCNTSHATRYKGMNLQLYNCMHTVWGMHKLTYSLVLLHDYSNTAVVVGTHGVVAIVSPTEE